MTEHDNGADLRERFDHAMNDLSAPEHLTVGVLNDGRRLRRRRRILTGAGGVATAAAVTAIVVATLGNGSTERRNRLRDRALGTEGQRERERGPERPAEPRPG